MSYRSNQKRSSHPSLDSLQRERDFLMLKKAKKFYVGQTVQDCDGNFKTITQVHDYASEKYPYKADFNERELVYNDGNDCRAYPCASHLWLKLKKFGKKTKLRRRVRIVGNKTKLDIEFDKTYMSLKARMDKNPNYWG